MRKKKGRSKAAGSYVCLTINPSTHSLILGFLLVPAFSPCLRKRSLEAISVNFLEAGESLHLLLIAKVQRVLWDVTAVVGFPELRFMRKDLYLNRPKSSRGQESLRIKFTALLTRANIHVSEKRFAVLKGMSLRGMANLLAPMLR